MTRTIFSKPMRIDDLNMPLLRSWNWFWADFYKDVTPTAFGECCVIVTSEADIQKSFVELSVL
jgi:hypothetical protein